ncbi:nucleic acid-binding, OB-fold protein [Tanacetum coccineum]
MSTTAFSELDDMYDVDGYVTNVGRSTQQKTDRLYLSSTSSTLIVDDEKIPLLKRLKTDDSGVELTKEILPADNTAPKSGTLENLLLWARNQIFDSLTFHCEVKIDKVRTKKGWNYPSCSGEKCKKGNLDRKEGRFWCDSCNISVEYPVIRYRLDLEISDDTAEVVVVMFDETTTSLLKCSASSIVGSESEVYFSALYNLTNTFTDLRLQDEKEHSGLPPALANIVGTSHTLELKSHMYYEHGPMRASPAGREELEDSDAEESLLQTVNQKEETWAILLIRGKGKGLCWMTRNEQPKFGHLGSEIIGAARISTPVESYLVFSTWMEFGGNTRDLSSFGEEIDEITDLHQDSPRSITYRT